MNTTWKVAGFVFVGLMICAILFEMLFVIPAANTARQIAGGYSTEADAKAALQKNPGDAFAHITLAHAAQKRDDRAAALQEWREVVRLDPQNGYAQSELGTELLIQKRPGEAKKVFAALAKTNHANALFAAKMRQKINGVVSVSAPTPAASPP